MAVKGDFKQFFQFNQSERKGIFALIILLLIALIIKSFDFKPPNENKYVIAYDSLSQLNNVDTAFYPVEKNEKWRKENKVGIATSKKVDINNCTEQELIALGFHANIAKRFIKYRSSQQGFTSLDQIKKVFGLSEKFYIKIKDQLSMGPINRPDFKAIDSNISVHTKFKVKPSNSPININEANFYSLNQLVNDSMIALKLLKYRSALGGFHDINQIKEVYQISDSSVQLIINKTFIEPSPTLKKLNLNLAEEWQLQKHPYISKKLSKLILAYRSSHAFLNIEELKKIPTVDMNLYSKLSPYLQVNEHLQ
jgi:competence protein ComEA